MFFKLTPTQHAILRDRLEVSDCIAEAMTEDGSQWTAEQIEDVAAAMLRGLSPRSLETSEADGIDSVLAGLVLEDVLDGSVYIGSMLIDASDARIGRAVDAIRDLAKRIGAAYGIEIEPATF